VTLILFDIPQAPLLRAVRRALKRGNAAVAVSGGLAASSLLTAGQALAQATSPAGGIGAQLNTISAEAINSGGTAGGMAMYILAIVCFIAGVWAIWQSRQPQNRESGRLAMGVAGIVLCGLFATGGVWINKAAVSASGGTATVNNTAQTVTFGAGG